MTKNRNKIEVNIELISLRIVSRHFLSEFNVGYKHHYSQHIMSIMKKTFRTVDIQKLKNFNLNIFYYTLRMRKGKYTIWYIDTD